MIKVGICGIGPADGTANFSSDPRSRKDWIWAVASSFQVIP